MSKSVIVLVLETGSEQDIIFSIVQKKDCSHG
jgi:hypothetical protein